MAPVKAGLQQVWRLFADLLEYPTPTVTGRAAECTAALRAIDQQAAARLEVFRIFAKQEPLSRLEEAYTATFDLQAVCYPYAGYQLFGEGHKWGAFLVQLKERYRMYGFSPGKGELPDHLPIILRFLAVLQDEVLGRELVGECLLPALGKMAREFPGESNPYGEVIRALLLLVRQWEGPALPLEEREIGALKGQDAVFLTQSGG